MAQAHIYYSGRVQGVGFRYTVHRYAMYLKLNGWVKNLPDGRVELLVEGAKETIDELCQKIKSYFENHIRDIKITYDNVEHTHNGFNITY